MVATSGPPRRSGVVLPTALTVSAAAALLPSRGFAAPVRLQDLAAWQGGRPAALCLAYVAFRAARFALRCVRFVWAHFLQRPHDLAQRYGGGAASHSYVVVTGATSEGIGFAFCEEWADRGFSIALVGRSEGKLKAVADKLQARMDRAGTGATVLKICADLGNVGGKGDGAVSDILSSLEGKDVAAVVHAAGVETIANPFTKNSIEYNREAINVNATAAVLLTQALLPQLVGRVEGGAAKRSAVIFVAAGLALRPAPGANLYAASKSMENFFGQAVAVEFAATVDSLVVHPLGVATAMVPEKPDGLSVITPQQCARASIRQLGHAWAAGSWTNGWFFHELQWGILQRAPSFAWHKMWMEFAPAKIAELRAAQGAGAGGGSSAGP